MKKLASLLLIMCAGLTVAHYWVPVKAQLAQYLIDKAWQKAIQETHQQKPWYWADTWPVAKLSVPAHAITQYVLADASGQSLAFGPGLLAGQAVLDGKREGLVVISGHRDTHFEFVQHLKIGDVIVIHSAQGLRNIYQVQHTEIKHSQQDAWLVDNSIPALKLITCYPFDALNAGGPLRYILTAEKVTAEKTTAERLTNMEASL